MADPARGSNSGSVTMRGDLGKARDAVMRAAERCAELSGAELRDLAGLLRRLVFNDDLIEYERQHAADEALEAAGLVPPPRPRLRAVTGPMRRPPP